MNRSPAAQANTFRLSNMAPHLHAFNGGIWARLECLVRDYAQDYGEVYVITGRALQEPLQRLPSGRVAIPSRFYKIVLRSTGTATPVALAIVLPHPPFPPSSQGTQRGTAADAYLTGHTVSISEVKNLTSMDLLPKFAGDALKRAAAAALPGLDGVFGFRTALILLILLGGIQLSGFQRSLKKEWLGVHSGEKC